MPQPVTSPYGSWSSPITADLIVAGALRLSSVVVDGQDVYWIEGRPAEGGRNVIVRRSADGDTVDMTPPPFNARTAVHEYGGGSFTVDEGNIYFSNFADGRIYRQQPGELPEPITPEGRMRYADIVIDRPRNQLLCVREDHTTSDREPANTIVSIDLDGAREPRIILSGNDFYSSQRISPDGTRLAWLTWNHPNMPWDGTELWVASITEDGSLHDHRQVAGGIDESIFQPEWSPDGVLHFVSDRTGWWNLYRANEGGVENLRPMEAEFGKPQWVFGMSTYAFASRDTIICSYATRGEWRLARLDSTSHPMTPTTHHLSGNAKSSDDSSSGELQPIDTPYNELSEITVSGDAVFFIGGSPVELPAIVRLDLGTNRTEVLRHSGGIDVDAAYLSIPQAFEFPTEHGLTAHAFFYPPHNPDFVAPDGELPPLLVKSHGGPTGATSAALKYEIQYWASRGIAVLDVNYGGSTGYGTEYRRRLNGQWGVVDVDDCVNGAKYLVERGLVDGDRLAIDGGSAGGYTTLAALTFRDTFKAGASRYGICDLEALEKEGHKFEGHYNHSLLGPYPEQRDLYIARSPIHFTDRLNCPIILFQGLEDKVVPPNQAEMMFEAVKRKGLPVAYVPFEGEQHGFRKAENIRRALEGEFYFFARVFGYEPADEIEPVMIENG